MNLVEGSAICSGGIAIHAHLAIHIVGKYLGGAKVIGTTHHSFGLLGSTSSRSISRLLELLNSSTHQQRAVRVAQAQAIALVVVSGGISRLVLMVTSKCLDAHAGEVTEIVHTRSTIHQSAQVGRIKVTGSISSTSDGQITHWGIGGTDTHLAEVAFQAHESFACASSIAIVQRLSLTFSRVESAVCTINLPFVVEHCLQAIAQIFRTLEADTAVTQVADIGTSRLGLDTIRVHFLVATADVGDAVQGHGRLSGSSASGSQGGKCEQRFFHCKFLQG